MPRGRKITRGRVALPPPSPLGAAPSSPARDSPQTFLLPSPRDAAGRWGTAEGVPSCAPGPGRYRGTAFRLFLAVPHPSTPGVPRRPSPCPPPSRRSSSYDAPAAAPHPSRATDVQSPASDAAPEPRPFGSEPLSCRPGVGRPIRVGSGRADDSLGICKGSIPVLDANC